MPRRSVLHRITTWTLLLGLFLIPLPASGEDDEVIEVEPDTFVVALDDSPAARWGVKLLDAVLQTLPVGLGR